MPVKNFAFRRFKGNFSVTVCRELPVGGSTVAAMLKVISLEWVKSATTGRPRASRSGLLIQGSSSLL